MIKTFPKMLVSRLVFVFIVLFWLLFIDLLFLVRFRTP
jgi:hypothetical protein